MATLKQHPISKDEFEQLKAWLDQNQAVLPEHIAIALKKMVAVYSSLVQGMNRARQTLHALRQAIGILPKSERGKSDQLKLPEALPSEGEMSQEERQAYQALQNKRAEAIQTQRLYERELKRILPKCSYQQLELDLERPCEMVFSYPSSERGGKDQKQEVKRMQEFGKQTGLHTTYDYPTRVDFTMQVTEITYQVETVTDPETGKSVRASMQEEGPEGFGLTWRAIANLIKLHVGFAIPINRMELMIGQPEFSSGKITRILEWVAVELLGVYLVLFDELSDVSLLSGDDTSTKVIDLSERDQDSVSARIDEELGWCFPKANGEDKKSLNVSLLVGRTQADPRSTIRFYRTHLGSVGNLLSQVLERRKPQLEQLIFQGDLSKTNWPEETLRERFDWLVAGCGAHARRPFWKHREEDPILCYFMLRGFAKLAFLEKKIEALGRTRERVLKYRQRYGRKIWEVLRNRAHSAVTGERPRIYNPKLSPEVWPPGHVLHTACQYVIKHFEELTLYLNHPELEYTNNAQERALRIEKAMLKSSKFRKTRKGRAVLDILRTLNATTHAARIDITDYLRYVFKHRDQLRSHPEQLTPFAVALALEKENSSKK